MLELLSGAILKKNSKDWLKNKQASTFIDDLGQYDIILIVIF